MSPFELLRAVTAQQPVAMLTWPFFWALSKLVQWLGFGFLRDLRTRVPPLDLEADEEEYSTEAIEETSWDPEANAFVMFTTGSTGPPKAVGISHRMLSGQLRGYAAISDNNQSGLPEITVSF